jgi:D-galactarolactone cycloisomerase
MKISRVIAVPLSIPFQYGLDNGRRLEFCLVRVETDQGIVGWGDAFAYNCLSPVVAAVNDMIAPLAVGHDAEDIAGLNQLIQRKLHIFGRFGVQAYAISGLDIALWDIAGKAAGEPVHRLLGGARRTSIPCYASLLRYGDAALAVKYCERVLAEGFPTVKLHEVNDAVITAARAAVPKYVPLTLDVNCEWLPKEAIAAAMRFRPHRLHWLEEPAFPPEDFATLRTVGEESGIPVAAGENLCFATQFKAAFDARALDYAQPSVIKVGGITEFVKVLQLATERGVKVAPHSPYFGPGALATLHLLAALVPEALFEYYYLSPEASLYPGMFGAAAVKVPDGPGLGRDPHPEILRRYRA